VKHPHRLRTLSLTLAATASLLTVSVQSARAEPTLTEDVDNGYWLAHGIATGVSAGLALITGAAIDTPPPDVRPVRKPVALAVSQAGMFLQLVSPAPVWTATMDQKEFLASMLMYGEASFLALTVNHALRFPGLDSSSTLAFAAAYAGSATVDRQRDGYTEGWRAIDAPVRDAFWGIELGLATLNAHLEVRSGRRGYLNALTGAVLGTAVGMTAASLREVHDSPFRLVSPSEHWHWGLLGALPGIFVPICIHVPENDPLQTAGFYELRVSPWRSTGDARGLAVSGTW
jgi:hypothetical protein